MALPASQVYVKLHLLFQGKSAGLLHGLGNAIRCRGQAEVRKAAQIVHLKDAAIVSAAAQAKAEYLATHDVKHLLNHAQAIAKAYGITVLPPAELLNALTN